MSYESVEASINSGKPIELYDFSFGVDHWRYTSSPEAVTYLTNEYQPEMIERSDLEITDNAFKNELEIKINRNNLLFYTFIHAPVEGILSLTIYRGHDPDYVTFWAGVVSQVNFNTDEITITATPRTSSLLRTGLRRKYQKLCNHPLYKAGCSVNRESYKITGTIATISGFTIVSAVFATKADGWFNAGEIIVGDAERLITTHVGSTITISRGIYGAVAGNSFTAYAGCDHSMDICRTKFDNLINYGGQPWIPTKNPFSGDAII